MMDIEKEPADPADPIIKFLDKYEALADRAMLGKVELMGQYATMLADIATIRRMREFLALRAAHEVKVAAACAGNCPVDTPYGEAICGICVAENLEDKRSGE